MVSVSENRALVLGAAFFRGEGDGERICPKGLDEGAMYFGPRPRGKRGTALCDGGAADEGGIFRAGADGGARRKGGICLCAGKGGQAEAPLTAPDKKEREYRRNTR